MVIKTLIFDGYNRVLQVGAYFTQRNHFTVLLSVQFRDDASIRRHHF